MVETVVRVKVTELAADVATLHGIAQPLVSASIEEDILVLR